MLVAGLKVAIWQQQTRTAIFIKQEIAVVTPADQGSGKRKQPARAAVVHTEIPGMRSATKRSRSPERRKNANRDRRKCGIIRRRKGITRERAFDNSVQVCIATARREVLSLFLFELDLRSLGPEYLRIDGCPKFRCLRHRFRHSQSDQSCLRDKLNAIAEVVMEVGNGKPASPGEELLVDSAVKGPGSLGSDGRDVILRDQRRSVRQCSQQPIQ